MKFKILKDGTIPTKSHKLDCGLDIYLPECFEINPMETIVLGLKLCVSIPEGCAGMLVPRSSTAKKGIISQTQIIDPGYTGEIHLIITNCSNNKYTFNKNDRICSLVVYNLINPVIEVVEELENSERGNFGLGSTGK